MGLSKKEREARALKLVNAGSDLGEGPITYTHERDLTAVSFSLYDGRTKVELVRHELAESFLLHGGAAWRYVKSCTRPAGQLVRVGDAWSRR